MRLTYAIKFEDFRTLQPPFPTSAGTAPMPDSRACLPVLLYYNSKLYRIVPKRALTRQAAKFQALVRLKLSPYDYRNPAPPN
jgi:hypothetical protein